MYGQDRGLKVDGSEVPSSRAKTYAIGYSYSFSKRTDVYAYYTVISNDSNSNNDFANGGIGASGAARTRKAFRSHPPRVLARVFQLRLRIARAQPCSAAVEGGRPRLFLLPGKTAQPQSDCAAQQNSVLEPRPRNRSLPAVLV